MLRVLLGFVKGMAVGLLAAAVLLYAEPFLGSWYGVLCYVSAALVGGLVGFVCGRAPWRTETFWVPALRVVLGIVLGPLVYGLGHAFLPAISLVSIAAFSGRSVVLNAAPFLLLAMGTLYGVFVELDDGGSSSSSK